VLSTPKRHLSGVPSASARHPALDPLRREIVDQPGESGRDGRRSSTRHSQKPTQPKGVIMSTSIKEHMEVIGADGVHVGTVDKIEGNRIKLTKADSGEGSHKGHHHFIDKGLVAEIEGNKVRLSANASVAVTFEEEK
jgi:hypothetical protein